MQAALLDSLMDINPNVTDWVKDPAIIAPVREKALAKALGRIVKQAADPGAPLTIVRSKMASTESLSFGEYLDSLEVYRVRTTAACEAAFASVMGQLSERKGFGLLSLVLSPTCCRRLVPSPRTACVSILALARALFRRRSVEPSTPISLTRQKTSWRLPPLWVYWDRFLRMQTTRLTSKQAGQTCCISESACIRPLMPP